MLEGLDDEQMVELQKYLQQKNPPAVATAAAVDNDDDDDDSSPNLMQSQAAQEEDETRGSVSNLLNNIVGAHNGLREENAELLGQFGGGVDPEILQKQNISDEYVSKQSKLMAKV